MNEDTYPEELKDVDSIVHCVGTLIEGRTPETSYKAMNRDSCIKLARRLNEFAKMQDKQKNFILISSEKAPPFLNEYVTTKREAEDFLLNECSNLRAHIIRPGFIVQPNDRSWSPIVACLNNIGYNINEAVVKKTPLSSHLDFLFPAHSTPLETIAEVAVGAAHNELPPQIWTNDMLLNFQK